jgi:Family of unknown function (DUF6440)
MIDGFLFGIGLYIALYLIHSLIHGGWRKDDSDSDKESSGFMILTDHRTGCQYLMTTLGGVTPRLDINGNPICKKEN